MKTFPLIAFIQLLTITSGFNMFGGEESDLVRPQFTFPESFEIGISTNDPGLNITEIIYYVSVFFKCVICIFESIGQESKKNENAALLFCLGT